MRFLLLSSQFICCQLGQQVQDQHDNDQNAADTEGIVILSLLHLQIQLDRQGTAGLHCLVGQLRQIVPESSGELRQLVIASCGK